MNSRLKILASTSLFNYLNFAAVPADFEPIPQTCLFQHQTDHRSNYPCYKTFHELLEAKLLIKDNEFQLRTEHVIILLI